MQPVVPSTETFRRTAVSSAVLALVTLVSVEGASPARWLQEDDGATTTVVARLVSPAGAARSYAGAAVGLSAMAVLLALLLRRWPTLELIGPICPILARRVSVTVPTLVSRRLSISYRIGGRHGG